MSHVIRLSWIWPTQANLTSDTELLRYSALAKRLSQFKSFTGLEVAEFDSMYATVESRYEEFKQKRLSPSQGDTDKEAVNAKKRRSGWLIDVDWAKFASEIEAKMKMRDSKYHGRTISNLFPLEFLVQKLKEERMELDAEILDPSANARAFNQTDAEKAKSEAIDEAILTFLIWKKFDSHDFR